MKLHDYLANRKLPMAAWGRACGVIDRSTARRYVLGIRIPPAEVVTATYLFTAGAVTPNDFYDLPALPEASHGDSQEAA